MPTVIFAILNISICHPKMYIIWFPQNDYLIKCYT